MHVSDLLLLFCSKVRYIHCTTSSYLILYHVSVPQTMLVGDGQRGSGPLSPRVCAIFGEKCEKGIMDGCVVPACVSTKCKHCQKLDDELLGGDWKPNF